MRHANSPSGGRCQECSQGVHGVHFWHTSVRGVAPAPADICISPTSRLLGVHFDVEAGARVQFTGLGL